ncbi:MAG: YdeI/OmpD-associated family protein [Chryseosolibacter sp.]
MMAVSKMNFRFQTKLAPIEAVFMKTAVFLPRQITLQLPGGRIRVKGTLNSAPFALAVQHLGDGSRYFSVSAPLRKAAGIKMGDPVTVSFTIVDPDKLDVPEELQEVLAQDDAARKAWEKLTTGYRRSLIHYITSVKNVDSRIRRSLDLLDRAKAGLLHGQKTPLKKTTGKKTRDGK